MLLKISSDLYLDTIKEGDIENIVRFGNDPEVYRNTLTFPKVYTEKNARDFLQIIGSNRTKYGMETNWAIRLEATGEFIGGIGLLNLEGSPIYKSEMGYWMGKPYRGKGFTTLTVRSFTKFCMRELGMVRISATVFPHNLASMRVLEKAGFEREGLFKKYVKKEDEYRDVVGFAKTV